MTRSGRGINARDRIVRLADRLPAPRDKAARNVLTSLMDLAAGRPEADASPPPAATPPVPKAKAAAPLPLYAQPGHYYSPIVGVDEITGSGSDVSTEVAIAGIDLDLAAHATVWASWLPHLQRWRDDEESRAGQRRYHSANTMFGAGSARLLAGAIGAMKPRRYVEIGSGFSSAVLLDINEEWRSDDPIELTFIEPNPERLESILRDGDRERCTIVKEKVQSVDLTLFEQLRSGDVLFIDSSHVAKTSSDLLRELYDILPALADGVNVHFHDIPYPFDYPMRWLREGRSWNETYFLRAFLMYNTRFRVQFWTDYFALFGSQVVSAESIKPLVGSRPTSIWLTSSVR